MSLLDVTPILAIIIGCLLIAFVLFRKLGLGENRRIRYVLTGLISIYTLTSLDHYLSIRSGDQFEYYGISYLFFHLIGFLIYYFVILLIKAEVNVRKWLIIIGVYTLLRWALFVPILDYSSPADFWARVVNTNYGLWMSLEYLIVSLINIILIFSAYVRLRQAPLVVELDKQQTVQYKWAKMILIAFIIFQMGVLAKDIVLSFSIENYRAFLKVETMFITIVFFVFAYSIIHFPVFAFSGDFDDLPGVTKKKYAKSSLKDSSSLYQEIYDLVKSEALYLEYDLKLNTIAEKLDKSIHHISQAINQSSGKNFPDFINSFRIEKAKEKLLEPKPDTIYAISLDVGFNSKAAFYSAFKKATSQTPTEFKKAHK